MTQLMVASGLVSSLLSMQRNSTGTISKSSEYLVDAKQAKASAYVFRSLGTCWILKEPNAFSKSLAFCK